MSRVHYVLPSVCMYECACTCVCVHIYKYIFFHQTILQIPPDITVKQKSQYPMFLNSFLKCVSKRVQKAKKKTQFSGISLRNKPNLINHTKN